MRANTSSTRVDTPSTRRPAQCAISLGRIIPGLCVVIYSVIVAAAMVVMLQVRDV